MEPYNYASAFADIGSSYDAAMKGYAGGNAMQAQQIAIQQAQAKAQQEAQMRTELTELSKNPTTQGIIAATVKYPQLSENFKRSYDMLAPEEQRTRLEQATPVYMALHNNKPEIAAKTLREQATAYRNSGREQEAKAAEAKARMIDEDPAAAKINLGGLLSAAIGPDKFAKMMGDMGDEARKTELQPSVVKTAVAGADKAVADASAAGSEATTKAVTAKYAERDALADLEKKGWDIKKIQADISQGKEANRIAAMNAAYNREGNELKREELRAKIDDAQRTRDEKVRDYVAQGETEIAGVTDTKQLIDTILSDESSLRAVTGMGAWKGAIPGTENRSMAGKIEQLVNMTAAMNLDKLKGPMSDKDILFVKRISANLDRYQDEDTFISDLKKLRGITDRTEGKLRAKYRAPASSGTPAASAPALPAGWSVKER